MDASGEEARLRPGRERFLTHVAAPLQQTAYRRHGPCCVPPHEVFSVRSLFQSFEEKRMNMKLLGAAVAAALLGVSTGSFGQAGGAGSSASGQDTPREAGAAQSGAGSNSGSSSGAVTSGSTTGNATSGATTTADCSTLSGAQKRRCERDHNATSGGNSSAPAGSVTKLPEQSGPGTNDRTEPKGRPGVGTSSAGSN